MLCVVTELVEDTTEPSAVKDAKVSSNVVFANNLVTNVEEVKVAKSLSTTGIVVSTAGCKSV